MVGPGPVAVVGAGAAGLGVAITLRRRGVRDVTIYEKSRGTGGRMATRRRCAGLVVVQMGAAFSRQYLRLTHPMLSTT